MKNQEFIKPAINIETHTNTIIINLPRIKSLPKDVFTTNRLIHV